MQKLKLARKLSNKRLPRWLLLRRKSMLRRKKRQLTSYGSDEEKKKKKRKIAKAEVANGQLEAALIIKETP